MVTEEKKNSSLKHRPERAPRFRLSQIIIVVVLVISIIVAVLVGIPEGWRRNFQNTDKASTESLGERFTETEQSGQETLSEIRSLIADFKSITNSNDTAPEQLAVEATGATTTSGITHTTRRYINYDWGVLFQLPEGWSYSRERGAFVSMHENLMVERHEIFNIPEQWRFEEENGRYVETFEEVTFFYYPIEYASSTFLFIDLKPEGLSEEQQIIISSLSAL
jgi:hypothetical protein